MSTKCYSNYGLNSQLKEMITAINDSNYSPTGMRKASEEAYKAARDVGISVIGVNMSAYYTTESFIMSLKNLSESLNASPSNPIFDVDNARIHLTPEVGHTQQSRLNLGYLLFIHWIR